MDKDQVTAKKFSYLDMLKKNIVVKEEDKIENTKQDQIDNSTIGTVKPYEPYKRYIPNRLRPRPPCHKTGSTQRIFKSASLTFIGKSGKYLVANELRWVEKEDLYHPIGGKAELIDTDILYTGIREFVEETNMFMDESICKDRNKFYLIDKLYDELKPKIKYYDRLATPEGNIYHRYFVFNVNWFSNWEYRKKILELPEYYSSLKSEGKLKNIELNYIKWMDKNEIENVENKEIGSLLRELILNINNFV